MTWESPIRQGERGGGDALGSPDRSLGGGVTTSILILHHREERSAASRSTRHTGSLPRLAPSASNPIDHATPRRYHGSSQAAATDPTLPTSHPSRWLLGASKSTNDRRTIGTCGEIRRGTTSAVCERKRVVEGGRVGKWLRSGMLSGAGVWASRGRGGQGEQG